MAEKKKLDWKLGVQAYSFRKFTFFETVDKLASMGVKYVEAYPGQKIGKGIKGRTLYKMDKTTREKVLKKLSWAGVKLIAYGVVNGKNKKDWQKIFEFAKVMGIEIINCEPKPDHLDIVEKLCKEFNIKVTIHNHAKPKRYWKPEMVIEALKGRSKLMGIGPDNGHWARSGLESVENLRKVEGLINSMHLKDMDTFGTRAKIRKKGDGVKKAKGVPFGKGIVDIKKVLDELASQDYKGYISIEYESNPKDPFNDIKECVDYFNDYLKKYSR